MPSLNPITASTTLIVQYLEKEPRGSATGFFYGDVIEEGEEPEIRDLYLITNKHVVLPNESRKPDQLMLKLHKDPQNLLDNDKYLVDLYFEEGDKKWFDHYNKDVDVVAIPLMKNKILENFFIQPISRKVFLPDDYSLEIGDDAIVLGYPRGLHDRKFNLPIAREAMVSSPYPVPFEGRPHFLVDALLHKGMSGSPVFVKGTTFKTDDGVAMGGKQIYFLGVFSSGAHVSNNSEGDKETLWLNQVWFADLIEEII